MIVFSKENVMKKSNSMYTSDNEVLSSYLEAIDKIPLLSYEEEYELAVRAKNGDKKARDKIVSSNLRFVVSVAKKYRGQGLALEDLIDEGNIGLLTAVDKYEPEKGYHFISYAVWWIRQSILKALAEQSRPVRLPLNRSNELIAIMKAKNELIACGNASPRAEDIAAKSGIDVDTVKNLLDITKEMMSLDSPLKNSDNGDDDSSLELFVSDEGENPEGMMINHMMSKDIESLLGSLNDKERDIIEKRFGFKMQDPMSLSEIGRQYNLTKERIRQIERNALEKMRKSGENMGLEYYNAI